MAGRIRPTTGAAWATGGHVAMGAVWLGTGLSWPLGVGWLVLGCLQGIQVWRAGVVFDGDRLTIVGRRWRDSRTIERDTVVEFRPVSNDRTTFERFELGIELQTGEVVRCSMISSGRVPDKRLVAVCDRLEHWRRTGSIAEHTPPG